MSDHDTCPRFHSDPLPTASPARWRRAALAVVLPLFAVATACDTDHRDDAIERFRRALPSSEALALDVPGEEDLALDGLPLETIELPLGQPSAMRALAGSVRRNLHQLIEKVTDGFALMTSGRPTRRTANSAVWRVRSRDQGVERALVMRRGESHFEYSVWVRDFGTVAGGWRFLQFGRVIPGRDGDARGAMWINFDNDRHPRSRGKVAVLWSVIDDARAVDVTLYDGTADDASIGAATRNYSYREDADGGLLAFDAGDVDVHIAPDHAARERVRVLLRWNAERAVRADYSASGPEVHADGYRALIGSECWQLPDTNVSYESRIGLPISGASPVAVFERGERATCAFPIEEPPIVATPGRAPNPPDQPAELDASDAVDDPEGR